MKGFIHSIESCGTVDGPGLRYVIFLQGCPLRCKYCHNPDTWKTSGGTPMTPEEALKGFFNNQSFYKKGGVTVTGGEPLIQIDFLLSLFRLLKNNKIHTCIDTSGVTFNPQNETYMKKLSVLLSMTDLVMLDLKHIDPQEHKKLTGYSNENILEFAHYLDEMSVPLWVRHVVIPGITFDQSYLFKLGYAIGALKNLKALDVLPYHSMGTVKYEQMGREYPLKGTKDLTKEEAVAAKSLILKGIRKKRLELENNP